MQKMIRNKIKKVLFILARKIGLYASVLPTSEEVYHKLSKSHEDVRRFWLVRLTSFLSICRDHTYYNQLLELFVPSWDLDIKKTKFVGKGIGENSLNSFRAVQVGNNMYFEKVYFNEAPGLDRTRYLQTKLYTCLAKYGIKVPRVTKIYEGETLSIVYSDFLDLTPLKGNLKYLVDLSKRLITLSLHEDFNDELLTLPVEFRNFREHFQYQRNIELATAEFYRSHINPREVEDYINERCVLVVTHGDIQFTNAYKKNILIDWDSFGFYPVGLDVAFLVYRFLNDNRKLEFKAIDWLDDHYSDLKDSINWDSFKTSFAFFLFIFMEKLFAASHFGVLKEELIKNLIKIK